MAEQNENPASNPSTPSTNGQASGAQGSFSIPDGHVLARKDEYDGYRRSAEQYIGVKPYYEKGSKLGFKSAEDFDRWAPVIDVASRKKLDPRQIAAMFSDEADADLGKQEQPQFDPEKYKAEIMGEWRKESAVKEFQSLSAKEKDYVDTALRDMLGDDQVDDMTKSMYRRAVNDWMNENRELFPKEHPLHNDYLQPYNEGLAKKAVEYFKAEKTKAAGAGMAAKADAALGGKPKPSTPAGNGGGQGKPKNEPTKQSVSQDISDSVSKIFAGIPQ